jgi:plasmid maintenance system antidote protein VapI
LKERGWTQKDFARLLGKKVSEVNELIKGKRNITVHRDILLSALFDDEEKKWCRLQLEYDYYLGKQTISQEKLHDIKSGRENKTSTTQSSEVQINIQNTEPKIESTEKKIEEKILPQGKNVPKDKHKEHEIFRNF